MSKRRSLHAVAWLLLAVAAVVLWPQRWGGAMTYVVTSGSSMAPTWQAGDLAVLRAADDYAVGDVAAFRSEEVKQIVMHRIVEEEDGRYRFRGDDNDFVDPDRVTDEQVLGKLVLRVPRGGTVLSWLVRPVNLLIVTAALFLLVADRRDRTGGGARPPAPADPAPTTPGPPASLPMFLHVDSVDVPASAVVADLVCAAELRELAARHGRPVLHDRGSRTLYVLEGQVVYRCVSAGRTAADPPVAVPMPRDAVVRQLFGA